MAQQMQTRKLRQASPERWQKAAQRAFAEHIQVRQVNENGMWVSTSGSDATLAYLLEIRNGLVVSCSWPAGQFGDPCCKHAARYYLDAGLLDPEPEGSPPAAAAPVVCFRCRGSEAGCPVCAGAGLAPLATQADALVAAAGACDHCGGPLDGDAETDYAGQTVCAGCQDADREAARAARDTAIAAAHAQHAALLAA